MAENNEGRRHEQPNNDAVLGEVLINQRALRQAATDQTAEDQDLALAKLLQEQERAFLSLAGGAYDQGPAENVPPTGAPPSSPPGSGSQGGEDRPPTDEELAWRLMQEEEADFQRRMLALAGYAPGVAENGDNGGDDDSEGGPDPDQMSYEELTALGDVVGTVASGLTQAQIDALPVLRYSDVCTAGVAGEGAEEQCAVCRVEYEAEDEVKQLRCGHYYHPECVGQWLLQKKACPQCNRDAVVAAGAEGEEEQKARCNE